MKTFTWIACAALLLAGVAGCEGPVGPAGQAGQVGPASDVPGEQGTDGAPGTSGTDGTPGRNAYLTGPGLNLEILDVGIVGAKATVTFKVSDASGIPLDRQGLFSEGAVTTRFVLAWLDQTAEGQALQYTAYTTKDQTSPEGVTATQAAADEGGTYAEVDFSQGIYSYELAAPVNVADASKTHTLAAWGTRDFEGERFTANAVHSFLPSGGDVTVVRDVVKTESCNSCHNPLEAHGGQRRDVELCVTCHSPQTTDPDTGNTVDFAVMVHKIHRGKDLPSVEAGTPYQIVGYQQSVNDYSTVGYPQPLEKCDTCHTGAQGDNWKNRPTRAACGSCHDLVSFIEPAPEGKTLHAGGQQLDDTKCSVCHPPAGGLEGIETKHLVPLTDPASPVIALTIESVTKTAPGETPEMVFNVTKNGQPLDILATPLTRLVVTVAGPTTDYATYWQYTAQGSNATGTLTQDGASFHYVFPAAMPADATGSYAVGLEGYIQADASAPRYSAMNPVAFVAVTDPAPVPRRTVADVNKCNSCHAQLGAHGGARRDVQYCAFCHNPTNVNDERVSRFEGESVVAQSVDLSVMIHKIHMGEKLTQQPYTLGAFPAPNAANPAGTPIDFGEVRYPGDQKACWACHTDDSYRLPLAEGLLPARTQVLTCTEDPAADANAYCATREVTSEKLIYPAAAACTACHDAPAVVAHAETMTTASGAEACATCHGPGTAYDVDVVHALAK